MSELKPEVSDVWKMDSRLVHIKRIVKRPDRVVVVFDNLSQTTFLTELLITKCTFIGKSKASIKDLFEVE